jgi:anti-sigma regulatory factor (Ser/Thr protein kinase)
MLSPVDTAPADARATLRLTLKLWKLDYLSELAETISSELVTNAITASRDKAPEGIEPRQIIVRLTASSSELYIRVWDPCPTPPPEDADISLPGDDEESGRGLFIVKALSDQWGTYPGPNGGKFVWASLVLTAPPLTH